MGQFSQSINLIGTGTAIAMSTAINCSAPLSAGQYAVWATGQTGYVSLAVSSSLFTAATGYPVPAAATAAMPPVVLNVPYNGQIGAISTSSGTVVYQQVG